MGFLLCLLLGFRGKYSVSNDDEVNDYISRLKKQCGSNLLTEEKRRLHLNKERINHRGLISIYHSRVSLLFILYCCL